MIGALIHLKRGQTVQQTNPRMQRIFGAVRIGRMALNACHSDPSSQRPAATDLHRFTHNIGAGRLAHQTHRHRLVVGIHPIKQCNGAVQRDTLFIARYRQHNSTIRRRVLHKINGSSSKGSHTGLHIRRPAAI